MWIPNGRPQSPMWFSRTTSWPRKSSIRHERVADDGGAEVPDVHLLGDVRRRVVDDDALRPAAAAMPEPLVGGDAGQRRRQERVVDRRG